MSDNGLSNWSCIYCGQALSGPQEGQEHQESGECRGPFPKKSEYVQVGKPPTVRQPREPRNTERTHQPRLGDRRPRK